MKESGRRVLLWAPRSLLGTFALFLVIFSFDVFTPGKSAFEMAIDFAMHNIPSVVIGLIVFMAWRREWIGVLACLALSIAYLTWAWGRFPPVTYVVMTGPLFLIAALYAVNWRLRNHERPEY